MENGKACTPRGKPRSIIVPICRATARVQLVSSDLLTSIRHYRMQILQPEGASFTVEGNLIEWQKWSLRVGFNYREGLVLHDVCYDGRPVLWRGSLVEMAVPYGDPRTPFQRKCAFDVGMWEYHTERTRLCVKQQNCIPSLLLSYRIV